MLKSVKSLKSQLFVGWAEAAQLGRQASRSQNFASCFCYCARRKMEAPAKLMSWSTAFVHITESSRNLNYRGTELQDQLSRFQFTETKLPYLNQLGISFVKARGSLGWWVPCSAAVEQWLGLVKGSAAGGLPSDRHILLLLVSLKVRNLSECPDPKSVCKCPSASAPQTLELLQNSKGEAAKIFSWALEMHLYLPSCIFRQKSCCPTYPDVFAARILHLQLYRTIRSSQGVWMLGVYSVALPTAPRKGQTSVVLDECNQTSNTNLISS